MIAPEPYRTACLEVLYYATIHARALALGNTYHLRLRLSKRRQAQIADLMDAVHNIPHLMNDWERCNQKMLRDFLLAYDHRWGSTTGGMRLADVYDRVVAEWKNGDAADGNP